MDAVLFDWRGTLVLAQDRLWVSTALTLIGRDASATDAVLNAIRPVAADLDAPGIDADPLLHARVYRQVLADAGLDADLVEALYTVDSDPLHNSFALDAGPTLRALHDAGVRVAVVSDTHVDIRPAFAAADLDSLVEVFTLSFEQGVQKPDPAMFTRTVAALDVSAAHTLMVGDRSQPDGAAVELGLTTLLLPQLRSTDDRRLHHVLRLCGI